MNEQTTRAKLKRLRLGGTPRALDLFAGCGGLSLGFEAAGFQIAGAVEFDKDAAASHGANFHDGDPVHCTPIDITETSPKDLQGHLRLNKGIDVIVGGPPCQAFARVGRSKLREVEAHPHAYMHDARAKLYTQYLEYVDYFEPLAVVMENVPDMLNFGGRNIAEETCEVLEARGYVCRYTLLNSAFYGVPQMRERMFLIGYRKELCASVVFPSPSHWLKLPPGYEGSRAVALKALRSLVSEAHHYTEPPASKPTLQKAITARQAIGDLPEIDARALLAEGLLRRGAKKLNVPMAYDTRKAISNYAVAMKTWPGHEAHPQGVFDHLIRYLPRDYELFSRLEAGDQYPQAHARALQLFEEKLAQRRKEGEKLQAGSKKYVELRKSVVPPYDPEKFPNKWRKMWSDEPARTLMAHLGKDSYSHIHYDSRQARPISIREAARLQSFPDGFIFRGTMNPAFRQIGNAVPPLLAKAVGTVVREALCGEHPAENIVVRVAELA